MLQTSNVFKGVVIKKNLLYETVYYKLLYDHDPLDWQGGIPLPIYAVIELNKTFST